MINSLRKVFLAALLLSVFAVAANAQDTKSQKHVFGNGGWVSAENNEGMKLHGVTGQFAIGIKGDLPGTHDYYVHQGFWVLDELPTSVEETEVNEGGLANFPNPFSNSTTIKYELPGAALVTLKIYDMQGNEVVTLVDQPQGSGEHNVTWNAQDDSGMDVTAGSYLYELNVQSSNYAGAGFDNFQKRNVMIVVR